MHGLLSLPVPLLLAPLLVEGGAHVVDGAQDVDLDGSADVIVGTWRDDADDGLLGVARLYSGRNGKLIREWIAAEDGSGFGTVVAGLGDADGDGASDVAVAAPFAEREGEALGLVLVYSGRDEEPYLRLWGEEPDGGFGAALEGAGDVDQDGFQDVVVGAPDEGAGRVRVFSGKDGELLYTWSGERPGERFGRSVDSAGDFDADSSADVVVGARGSVAVYSGIDGALLWRARAPAGEPHFGIRVSSAGDIDQSGSAAVLIAAPAGADPPFWLRDRSAEDWGVLAHEDLRGGGALGSAIDGVGDLDADGFADIAVADPCDRSADLAPWLGVMLKTRANRARAGRVLLLSGHDGRVLHTLTGEEGEVDFGLDVAEAGDVDQDGFFDVVVALPATGEARIYSGKTGKVLAKLEGGRTKQKRK